MVDYFTYFPHLTGRSPFTEEQAEKLIGFGVTKRLISPENPAVRIGQQGTVIRIEPLDVPEGWSVVVNWGDHEIWTYDDWYRFFTDTNLQLNSLV